MCCWPGHVKRNTFVRCRNGRSLLYYRLGRDYEKHDVNHNIDQLFLVENVCDYQQSGALNAQLCWICSGNCSEIEYIRPFWPLQIAQCTLYWHALHKMCNCSARRQEWASEKKTFHFILIVEVLTHRCINWRKSSKETSVTYAKCVWEILCVAIQQT